MSSFPYYTHSSTYLSCNLHQLLHLANSVENLGPLHTFSCFDHEDSNGKISRMVHSRSGVDVQIVTAFSMLQSLSSLCSSLHLFQEILPRYCKYSGKIECAKLLGAGTEIMVESSLRNI